MNERTIDIEGKLQFRIWETDSGHWIGVCDALKIVLQAESETEMANSVQESLDLIFADLIEEGELEQYLTDLGWQTA